MNEPSTSSRWFLEGFTDESHRIWRTPLVAHLPFRIGRSSDCQLYLDSPSVSQRHAEIVERQGGLRITDVGSTNGTYVNDDRIDAPRLLADGDVVRFSDWEFRVVRCSDVVTPAQATEELKSLHRLPSGELDLDRQFRETIRDHSLWAVFQPIVHLADRDVVGYEALGRGSMGGEELSPGQLFAIAEGLGRAEELAELFRCRQLADAASLPGDPELFLNTHPTELRSTHTLVESITGWRGRGGTSPRLCIEINETAAIGLGVLRGLCQQLSELGVNVAFDDFGTGQTRLFELAEISPGYLKFDRVWIRDLDTASERRIELVRTLVQMVQGFQITPVAEGVERREEADACAEIGFELAQGFYLGRPERASAL